MNALVKLADREMAVETSMEVSNRVERLKKAVQAETNGACIERPMLWTKYHRNKGIFFEKQKRWREADKSKNVDISSKNVCFPNIFMHFCKKRFLGVQTRRWLLLSRVEWLGTHVPSIQYAFSKGKSPRNQFERPL